MKVRAAVARAGQGLSIENCELAEPGEQEVRVKVEATGICHTDLIALSGNLGTPLPAVLGHEGVGRIEASGPGVTGFSTGQRVLMSFGACGGCSSCQRAEPAYCHQAMTLNLAGTRLDGSSPVQGENGEPLTGHFFAQSSFATHCIARTTNLVALPDDIPAEHLAPLACSAQTGLSSVVTLLRPAAGSRLAVFGCGTVGLSAVIAARNLGCKVIVAIDRNPDRLALAKELGATHLLQGDMEALKAQFKDIGPVHNVFDTTGVPALIALGMASLLPQGKVLLAGVSPTGTELKVDLQAMVFGGRSLAGTIEGNANPRDFIPDMVHWYREGKLPLDRLVRCYDFEQIDQAVEDLRSGAVVKPVLRMATSH